MRPLGRCSTMLPAGDSAEGKAAKPSERVAQFRQFIKLQNSLGRGDRGDGEQACLG